VRRAFASAPEAMAALEEVVADESVYVSAPVALETFLTRYIASLLEPMPVEVPAPAAPPQASARPAPQAPPRAAEAARAETPAEPGVQDISDLIPARELEALSSKPLFNPDEPFSVRSEEFPPMPTKPSRGGRSFARIAAVLVGILAVGGGGVFASRYFTNPAEPAATATTTGTLIVQSNPAGVQVFVDGVDRGMTPARLSVTPGAHILELRGRGVPRVIPLQVPAGGQVSQYLEFADTPTTGRLQVQSEPAGAKVTIDGAARGVAPLTVADLTPGDHEVLLQGDAGTVRHVVTIQAGMTASLLAPMSLSSASGPVSGWLTVKAPFT